MKYRIGFTKEVHGFIEVEADTLTEAREKFSDGDWIDEFDNKSNYIFDENKKGKALLVKQK